MPGSQMSAERVRIGALVLGRGTVHQYATHYYLDRGQLPRQAWARLFGECVPCAEDTYFPEPHIEGDVGKEIPLKRFVEDIEHAIYETRHIDSLGKRKEWRLASSGAVIYFLLASTFLLGVFKELLPLTLAHLHWMTLFETTFALWVVTLRIVQTLVLYWREREMRRNVEVTAWADGSITRGRPISLFILMWIYATTQGLVCCSIIAGSLALSILEMPKWTILSTCLPVFLVSEFFTSLMHRHLEVWCCRIIEDQLKVTLLEATDLFEVAWRKTRDDSVQNTVYNFKQAITNTFHLDTLKLAYIRQF